MPSIPTDGTVSWAGGLRSYLLAGHKTDGSHFDGVFNVTNPTYGAVAYTSQAAAVAGTDSTAALQAAFDAAAVVPRGVVVIPPGFYKFTSTIRLPSAIRILGAGSNDWAGTVLVWVNSGTTPAFDSDSTTNLSWFGMEDIQIIDNRGAPGAPATGSCFKIYCPTNNTYFRRVEVVYFRGDAWNLLAASNGDPHCCFNALFEQCFAIYCGGYAFNTDGGVTGTWVLPDFNHMLSGGFYFKNGSSGNQNNILILQLMWEGGPAPNTSVPITFDNMDATAPVIIGPTFFGAAGCSHAISIKNGIGAFPVVIGSQGVNYTYLINDTANAATYDFARGTVIRDPLTAQQFLARGPSALIDVFDTAKTTNKQRFRARIVNAPSDMMIFDSRDDAGNGVSEIFRAHHTTGRMTFANGIGVGNSASATTPGSVVKKIEVFDNSGNSLGYLPVYSAIT